MAFQSVGSSATTAILFNSGILTLNGIYSLNTKDIALTKTKEVKEFYALNSNIKRAIRVSHFNGSLKATIIGNISNFYALWFSASSPVSGGTEYTTFDGQQPAATCYLTAYANDDPTKIYQYQLINPVISAHNVTQPEGDFESVEIDIMFTDLKLDVSTGSET